MVIVARVDNRIRFDSIPPLCARELKKRFAYNNPAKASLERSVRGLSNMTDRASRMRACAMQHLLEREPDKVETWQEDKRGFSVPRGGLSRARDVVEGMGYELDVVDERVEGNPRWRFKHALNRTLWDFQKQIVDSILEVEQGIVRSPTGSGKTCSAMAAMCAVGLPTIVVVSTGNLLDQWIRRLRTDLGLSKADIGVIGRGEDSVRPITVGMAQTLTRPGRCEKITKEFGFVVADEVHVVAAPTFRKVIDLFPARYRVGFSDDERRKDRKEFLLYDAFGAPIAEVDRDSVIDAGHVLDVEVLLVPTETRIGWWESLSDDARPNYWTQLVEAIGADEERNQLVASIVGAEPAEQFLVFAHREDHCLKLQSAIARVEPNVGLLVARLKREFALCLSYLMSRTNRVGVGTYQAVGTALDLPLVSRGVAASPIHNNKQFTRQVRGRLCRSAAGKTTASLYVLWDRYLFGNAPLKNWAKWSRTSRVLIDGKWVDARTHLESFRPGGAS